MQPPRTWMDVRDEGERKQDQKSSNHSNSQALNKKYQHTHASTVIEKKKIFFLARSLT